MNKTDKLLRRGLFLEYTTLGWNVAGLAVVMYAAIKAHSVALAGFGLDSLIEIGASTVVIWELTESNKDREKKALRFIGGAFFTLALYVLAQSARTLYLQIQPDASPLGMAWLLVTFGAMVTLAQGKRIIGTQLNDPVLLTEGRVTMIDAYLAASVLMGLVLNAFLGWWWADPLAALVIVYYGFKEGRHAWLEGI